MTLSTIGIASIALLCSAVASAQDAPRLVFEAASVRPSAPGAGRGTGPQGGPGTNSPGRMSQTRVTLQILLRQAYGVGFDQIEGPGWISEERYDLIANVPAGATREQAQVMLQNLLEDRFHLKLHRTTREFPAYELTIAKGGSKLKENTETDLQPAGLRGPLLPPDQDGFPQVAPGRSGAATVSENGLSRATYKAQPLSVLLFDLQARLGTPTGANTYAVARVVDKTGLTGKYDFKLAYASSSPIGGALTLPADPTVGPSFVDALEQQLGLKLTKSVTMLEVLVIDSVEKTPTEN